MRHAVLGFAILLGVGLTMPSVARCEQGQIISKYEAPAKAKAAIDGATTNVDWIIGYKFANSGNSWYRLLGIDQQHHKVLADATAEGKPLGVYTMIAFRELPQVVQRAVYSLEPQFTPSDEFMANKAAGMNDRKVLYYEVHGTTPGNKGVAYQILADGTRALNISDKTDAAK